ncbi:S1-C subfamily serine protease [Rhodococcus sp. 27YEA15]|uniref:S1C family serine protease n=1 Tax=Rhodococcus sp. 27YEA15 TaxID=3156259 RepID=UPI003C7D5DB8
MTERRSRRLWWAAAVIAIGGGTLAWAAPSLTPGTVASPPVVVITTTPPAPVIPLPPEEITARVIPTVVTITATAGFTTTAGTGIVLSPDGVVLTNHHVISGASDISAVNLSNGLIYDVDVLGYDSVHDLAVLRLGGASDLPVAVVGTSATLRRGDTVTAIGNAEGGGVAVPAPGTVTNLGVTVDTRNSTTGSRNQLKGMVEVDADIRPGDSGGPLVNSVAEVVGVNSAGNAVSERTDTSPAPQSYAIPIDDAMTVVDQVLGGQSTETVRVGPTPVLGVAVKDHRNPPTGAEVVAVNYDSPAEHLGLTKGSVITSFAANPVASSADLTRVMSTHRPGDRIDVNWLDADGVARSGSLILVPGPPR